MNPLKPFSEALRRLDLPFAVVGSLASSARGIPRATKDVDLVVHMAPIHAEELAVLLGPDWYVDAAQIRSAIESRRAFNVIHMESGWKIDVFPAYSDFHDSELRRAMMTRLVLEGDEVECPVSSAEDILLAKLRWYLDGGEVSEQQWNDIDGIVGTNRRLDLVYLRKWAERLGVSSLLAKALSDRGR
jgi:hypothetical protein